MTIFRGDGDAIDAKGEDHVEEETKATQEEGDEDVPINNCRIVE